METMALDRYQTRSQQLTTSANTAIKRTPLHRTIAKTTPVMERSTSPDQARSPSKFRHCFRTDFSQPILYIISSPKITSLLQSPQDVSHRSELCRSFKVTQARYLDNVAQRSSRPADKAVIRSCRMRSGSDDFQRSFPKYTFEMIDKPLFTMTNIV